MMSRHLLVIGAALVVLPACDNRSSDEPTAQRQAQAQTSPAGDLRETTPFVLGADWRASVDEAIAELRTRDPELVQTLYALEPRSTRAGTARFTGPLVHNPVVAAVFLDRLTAQPETSAVRVALVDALPRTGGSFGAAVTDVLSEERDAAVRVAMLGSLRTAEASSALAGLELGLSDSDATVRLAAARTAARRPDGARLEAPLLVAAADADARVKLEAVRTLGVLRIEAAKDLVEAELGASDAELRLAAVRALIRIDPKFAAERVRPLMADADARVAKAAERAATP